MTFRRARRGGPVTDAATTTARLAVVTFAALLLGGCDTPATLAPDGTESAAHSYAVCTQSGELPAKEINDDAVRILTERLRLLGVSDPEVTVGTCIDVAVELASQDPDAVAAAVLGTGEVSILPVPVDQAQAVVVGGEPPIGVEPIVGSDDFVDASTGSEAGSATPTLTLTLSDAGGGALGSWTTSHVGQELALVVDGEVIALPAINAPMSDGSIVIAFPGTPRLPLEAIRAMVGTGPLPPEWDQPQRPQG